MKEQEVYEVTAQVIGYIYEPDTGTCAKTYTFKVPYSPAPKDLTRTHVAEWVKKAAVDFSTVTDFYAIVTDPQKEQRKKFNWRFSTSWETFESVYGQW